MFDRGYIDETGRPLTVRLREHRHNVKEDLLANSNLAQHVYEEDYMADWDEARNFGNLK
jgi:hypothetical protein